MAGEFITFKKFNDSGLAEEIAAYLIQNNIDCIIENNQKKDDPIFGNNVFEADIAIKLKQQDFKIADKLLEEYYKQLLDAVDQDYYLFSFSDTELMEIITNPDEWGYFDYQLAQRILSERGKEVSSETAALLKKQRINALSIPEKADTFWVYIGYLSAILGGFLGLIIGWIFVFLKKTLPDGQRVHVYNDNVRNDGKVIFGLSIAGIIFWWFIKFRHFFE